MAELDIESALRVDLERCRSAYEQLERASLSLVEDRDRLRAVVQSIADEPEVDGRCSECALDGYHEDWCSRGKCIAVLEDCNG